MDMVYFPINEVVDEKLGILFSIYARRKFTLYKKHLMMSPHGFFFITDF